MEEYVEFYQTSCWSYKPKAIKKVIEELAAQPVHNGRVEVLYDLEQRWFKITCHQDDAETLRRRFAAVAAEIEEDALGSDYEKVIGPSCYFDTDIDNEWIAGEQEYLNLLRSHEAEFKAYAFPTALASFQFKTCWDSLEKRDDGLTLDHVVSDDKLSQMEQETNVRIVTDLGKSLVFIGSHTKDCIHKAKGKLDVLLASKNMALLSLRNDHVLFTDNYVDEKLRPGFMVDLRYMTNIHPRLTSSTLLDPATVRRLDGAYSRMYEQGVSLRLCPYSYKKKWHVSLLGPHIPEPKTQQRYVLSSRPTMLEKDSDERPITAPVSQVQARATTTESRVVSWMEGLSIAPSSELRNNDLSVEPCVHPFDLEQDNLGPLVDVPAISTTASATELIDMDSPSGLDEAALNTPVRPPQDIVEVPAPPLITVAPSGESGHSQHSGSTTRSLMEFSDDDVPTPRPFKYHDDFSTKRFHAMNQQSGHTAKKATPAPSAVSKPASKATQKTSNAVGMAAPSWTYGTVPFAEKLNMAIAKLLHKAPYRRGWVEVRVEFGRILLGDCDESALSFNSGQSAADGWDNQVVVYMLEQASRKLDTDKRRKDLRFTKILTTHGCDAEALLNMWNDGKQIWDPEQRKVDITYAIHCEMKRKGEEPYRFAIETRQNDTDCSVMVKPFHPIHDGDGIAPVYVHGLKHNWDMRVMLSHVDHDEVDKRVSRFAMVVFNSLQIRDNNGPNLTFCVPNYSATVTAVRALTRWYYPSIDRQNELQITEVEQLDMDTIEDIPNAAPGEKTKRIHAHPRLPKACQIKQRQGDFERWYEAAVLSTQLQESCQMNSGLKLGDVAAWSPEEMYRYGGFTTLYGPAIAMLKQMDKIGQNEDNNLSGVFGGLLKRANDPPPGVPGSSGPSSQHLRPHPHSRGGNTGFYLETCVSASANAASRTATVRSEKGEAGKIW
ncbi:LOW QUALITY PROTEIN: hypothetical protein QC763_103660 [Podospora pseudopauciseta]|uniref:DUF7905 domain-containing protein n=1 Tax=Podospora pseudopauciseta TaxID=2093780 RepID=A0ABR0HX85_9PEZI|nr:LOW QUALITY PROTEIN: hypothetical protein QC763_103660 [Podospora pseudopauciseta]